MNKDLVYIFNKITFKREELGEIQRNFNMSFVIDGTKDSTQLSVWTFNESEIEPNTICWHAKTNTWWVVSHDKIERYLNENGSFLYIHTLQLVGAIDILNARDLTDCGFNQRTYTIGQFLNRLIDLSSFEFKGDNFVLNSHVGNDFLNKKVDFVKTFENYTPLSAIRELLDGYNMCPKLTFATRSVGNDTYLNNAVLEIVSKTGSNNYDPLDMDDFDDVRETKTMDKNSFGTCVISNAENVISSKAKTYPSTGSVRLSSTEWEVTYSNAILRLPSKVFKGNWLKMLFPINLHLVESEAGSETTLNTFEYHPMVNSSFYDLVDHIYTTILNTGSPFAQARADAIKEEMLANKDFLFERFNSVGTTTLYEGNKVVPYYGANNDQSGKVIIEKGENVPYLSVFSWKQGQSRLPHIFTDKSTRELLQHKEQGVAWERGSNLITGFEFLHEIYTEPGRSITIENTDYQSSNTDLFLHSYGSEQDYFKLTIDFDLIIKWRNTSYIVNYIPMSDIKVKVDNTSDKKDIQFYNQNGKLTDNVALSKLLNSYSKEISSDTITKFMQYHKLSDVPLVGNVVVKGNENYVINNVSLDFTQNEKDNNDFGYHIDCEITMSKYVSTKSLMVNPNTNIRDYGIPQTFNVKRKQVYRDFYEIRYTLDVETDDDYYIEPQRMFTFGRETQEDLNLIAVIQCDYKENINGYSNWYYQLETTTYNMNKMVYVVCDFNDNNIIGYSGQNAFCGFNIKRVFKGLADLINTPISYVDAEGNVKGFDIMFFDNTTLTSIYNEYEEEHSDDTDYSTWKASGNSLYNYSTFIPQDIYLKARQQGNYALRITESTFVDANSKDYEKDAIEVPVFEYACQVDDSNNVLIGDNILSQHQDCIYFYHYIVGDNLTQDNVIDDDHIEIPTLQNPYRYKMEDSATISYQSLDTNLKALEIRLYNHTQYDRDTNTWVDYVGNDIQADKDLAIFRHSYNLVTGEELVELMFIAKKVQSSVISGSGKILTLTLNHYKLN